MSGEGSGCFRNGNNHGAIPQKAFCLAATVSKMEIVQERNTEPSCISLILYPDAIIQESPIVSRLQFTMGDIL